MQSEDKSLKITVHNVLGWELDENMLAAVLRRIALHLPQAEIVDVYPQERVPADAPSWQHPGFLEWIMRVKYRDAGFITIGCVQRGIAQPVEFHS